MKYKPCYRPQRPTKASCCSRCREALKYRKEYYKKNKKKIKAYHNSWVNKNRKRFNAYYRYRWALKKSSRGGIK